MYIKSTHCQDVDTFWMHVRNTLSLNDISWTSQDYLNFEEKLLLQAFRINCNTRLMLI